MRRGPAARRKDWACSAGLCVFATLRNMPEDYGIPTPPPTPPPPAAPAMPYGQIPPYGSPYAAPAGYYGTMPPPRRRPWWFYVAVIAGSMAGVTLLVMAMVWSAARALGDGGNAGGFRFDGDRIAVIDVTGVILSPETVSSQLRRFGDDASVKAILLHINSCGGG